MTALQDSILIVEDAPGEAVLRRILADAAPHWSVNTVIDCKGFGRMRADMARFRNASHVYPHVLLTDLDTHACPAALLEDWKVKSEPPRLIFRIAVREVEAWLLGDRDGVAALLNIAKSKVPANPEAEPDPKQRLINLARTSRSTRIALEFCPAAGSKASQGPLYNERVTRFLREDWSLDAARTVVPSLDRACRRIAESAGYAT